MKPDANNVYHGERDCIWNADQVFICDECKRQVCYCGGCSDDERGKNVCDECWTSRSRCD